MSLPPLYTTVINKIPPGKKYVTPAVVIAVCIQESKGCPFFTTSDQQYKDNLAAASKYTTLPAGMLTESAIIKSGPYKGMIGKFRFEPSYWAWSGSHNLQSPSERFMVSCSWGVAQQMMRWVLPPDGADWLQFTENFKGNLDMQLSYCIKEMTRLMVATGGDLFKAYKGYNSGNVSSTDPAVIERALNVVKMKDIVQKQIAQG